MGMILNLRKLHYLLKKKGGKSSGPGALSEVISFMALQISSMSKSKAMESWIGEVKGKIDSQRRKSKVEGLLWRIDLKYDVKDESISVSSSIIAPLKLIQEVQSEPGLPFAILWKYVVLRSPSFTHWSLDLYFHAISSCFVTRFNLDSRFYRQILSKEDKFEHSSLIWTSKFDYGDSPSWFWVTSIAS